MKKKEKKVVKELHLKVAPPEKEPEKPKPVESKSQFVSRLNFFCEQLDKSIDCIMKM